MSKLPGRRELRKYFRYAIKTQGFQPEFHHNSISARAHLAAEEIRDSERGAAILIHGLMPRSGTVFVGELLRLHPDLIAYPLQIWEFPYLQHSGKAIDLQREFLYSYEQNMGKIREGDFLPLFGSAVLRYLSLSMPEDKRVLMKVPNVEYLHRFYQVFPNETLMVLIRDGRDLLESTLKTWPQLRFSMVAMRYRRAAEMVLACDKVFGSRSQGYWLARFEDAVEDPREFIQKACLHFDLDPDKYPYARIEEIKVRGTSQVDASKKVTWKPKQKGQNFNPIGKWQSWSRFRKWWFKKLAGQALIDLGYERDFGW